MRDDVRLPRPVRFGFFVVGLVVSGAVYVATESEGLQRANRGENNAAELVPRRRVHAQRGLAGICV